MTVVGRSVYSVVNLLPGESEPLMALILASRDTDVHGYISLHLCRSVSGETRICDIRGCGGCRPFLTCRKRRVGGVEIRVFSRTGKADEISDRTPTGKLRVSDSPFPPH